MAAASGPTAPAAARARCPAPASWGSSPAGGRASSAAVNLVQLDRAGKIYWNGAPIKESILGQFMTLVAAMTPKPRTHLEVDPAASCADVARIVALIAGAVDCRRTCKFRVAPWHPASPVSPPAPPAPAPRIR